MDNTIKFTNLQKQAVKNWHRGKLPIQKQLEKVVEKQKAANAVFNAKIESLNAVVANIDKTIYDFTGGYSYEDLFPEEQPVESLGIVENFESVEPDDSSMEIPQTELPKIDAEEEVVEIPFEQENSQIN